MTHEFPMLPTIVRAQLINIVERSRAERTHTYEATPLAIVWLSVYFFVTVHAQHYETLRTMFHWLSESKVPHPNCLSFNNHDHNPR